LSVVRLRIAEPADRALLSRLLAEYLLEFDGSTEPYRYFEAYWNEPDRLPFLIEEDSQVVGLCLIRVLEGEWHIAEFSVLPAKRRVGVGGAAVEDLAARALAAGATHLEAGVHPDKREALAFWLAAGFTIVSEGDRLVTRRAL
jgi:ribosomal protein S18 acetylase RimI-like enzyme